MMQFQFQLDGGDLNSNRWAFENGHIEGGLQIFVDGQVYLDELYVNVVELAIQIGKWLDSVRHGVVRDFVYDSLDYGDSMLRFFIRQDGVLLFSSLQKSEQPKLPIETVEKAVMRYLVALNRELHEIGYVQNLDCFLHSNLSENKKALMLFEQNEYAEAFALLKKLAEESPSVQSLNNLAWMYLREEEEMDEAEKVLEQVVKLHPQSPFPYMMLGEIALHKCQFERAKTYLEIALAHGYTEEAMYNLAMAHFKLGEYKQAAQQFAKSIGDSGMAQLHQVVAWMYAGEQEKAKGLLDDWDEEAYDYTEAIEIADVYLEMQHYDEACKQFEKEWQSSINSPYIVSRFAYTLWQLGDAEACQSIIQQASLETWKVIDEEHEEECDEHWTVQDKEERIEELTQEKRVLDTLFDRLQNGYVPVFEYDMYPMGGCQLFGCPQHGNAEYKGA